MNWVWILSAFCAVAGLAQETAQVKPGTEKTAPKREHFVFASDIEYLDGANLEALGSGKGGLPTTDSEGNMYLVCKYSTCRIRCIRADGRVETIAGDDRWPGNLNLQEGPAAYMPNRFNGPRAGDYSIPGALLTIYGLPLKGEEHGRIYFHWDGGAPYRIFKNKEKGDRWWFRQIGAPGKAKPPTTVGQSAKLDELDLTDARIADGLLAWQGNIYKFNEPKGEITCEFTLADYESKAKELLGRTDKKLGPPEHYVRTEDGSVYLCYFWNTYPLGEIFRMSPDRKQFEHIVSDASQKLKGTGVGAGRNGPGLTTTCHCGPADISFSGNILFLHSIDSSVVRRWVGGRTSSLCFDGEWREIPGKGSAGVIMAKHYQPGQHGANYIYITYPGEENNQDSRVYRIGPFDFTKPTVGPLVQETPVQQKKEEGVKP
jgi:hypothetical protein